MRIIKMSKITAVAIASALALSACSGGTETSPEPKAASTEIVASENLTTETAAKFVSEYYAAWFAKSDPQLYTDLQAAITEIVGDDEILNSAEEDPIKLFSEFPKDVQTSLANKTSEMNANFAFYDMSELSKAEVSVLNIMMMSLTSIFGSDSETDVQVTADQSQITIEGNRAEIPFNALSVKFNGEESAPLGGTISGAALNFPLVAVDGQWKVDGKKFLTVIMDSSQNTTETTPEVTTD